MGKFDTFNEYNKENYFKVALRIPKEYRQVLADLAEEYDTSINQLIINALERTYGINLKKKKEPQYKAYRYQE